jgi:hypothetical protein
MQSTHDAARAIGSGNPAGGGLNVFTREKVPHMRYLSALFAAFLLTSQVRAVIIAGGSVNSTASSDNPDFANVGIRGSGTAVYLGNDWVLTADHVGAGSTWFGNTLYNELPNSAVQLANPLGQAFTPESDLLMYQIQGDPKLPSVLIGSSPPADGWQVTMVGNGRGQNPSEAHWTSSWMSTGSASSYGGYIWSDTNNIRWGTNIISSVGIPQGVGMNSETAFQTTFNPAGAPFSAQGSPGDSGGAVLHQDASGQWTLAGIMFAINNLLGQPAGTSVFGDVTYSADLSVYRSEIYRTMAIPGDIHFDGVVNGLAIALVASEWGQKGTGANDPPGDVAHIGVVNGLDLAIVVSHWTAMSLSTSNASAAAVPEPSTIVLAVLGMVALLACKKWRITQTS